MLYSYLNKNNEEIKIPLEYQGQIVEYLPSDGGVASVSVRYLEKIENRLSLTLDESFQKTANGYLSQSFTTTVSQAVVDEEGLKVRQVMAAEGGVSDAVSMADSSLSTVSSDDMTYVGTLKKVE